MIILLCVLSHALLEPPGPPTHLSVELIGATWAALCWVAPVDSAPPPSLTIYLVTAMDTQGNISDIISTSGTISELNMTNLLPGISYEFVVQSVASFLGVESERSVISNSDNGTTPPTC